MAIKSLLGLGSVGATQVVANPYQANRTPSSFVKDTFNYGKANPNQPNQVIAENNPLGIPSRGTKLYCLG